MSLRPAPGALGGDDEGEAFARAVFGRFLRQATICRDIDDAIEHMHIVNDNSRTFEIRLGGETRIPIGRELILALAAKKKALLGLCETTLRTPRVMSNASVAATLTAGAGADPALRQYPAPLQAVVFPPPTALAAMESTRCSGGPLLPMVPAITTAVVPVGEGAVVDDDVASGPAVVVPGGVEKGSKERPATPVWTEPLPDQVQSPPNVSPETRPAAYYPASKPPAATSALVRPRDKSGPTTVFVRKVDTKIDREALVAHFSKFGDVVAISMNPTRGFAFVDYPSHDCVLRAVSAQVHRVMHKNLVVEVKKELPTVPPSRRREQR